VTALSFASWTSWYLLHANDNPCGDLSQGVYTDHFSHMNAARLFPRVGLQIWQRPTKDLVVPLTPEETSQLPSDLRPFAGPGGGVFRVDGWPLEKTFISSWAQYPRLYPPGDMVLVAPIAVAYHFSSLTFTQVNRILIVYFLLLAHISVFFVLLVFWPGEPRRLIGPLGLFIAYSELIHWSLEGFYDVALLAPITLAAMLLKAKRNLAALVAYCASTFIHYRAFFFAPLAIYAAYSILRNGDWRRWRIREMIAVAVAMLLGGTSLYTFGLLWPWFSQVQITNPVRLAPNNPALIEFVIVILVVALFLLNARAWFDTVMLFWMSIMWIRTPYTWFWYMLAVLPWLTMEMLGVEKAEAIPTVRSARLMFLIVVSVLVCNYAPAPNWLQQVFRR
jgi:hypothetical protein